MKSFFRNDYCLFTGCNNNKNKSGYNRLETDDIDSDAEFYQKGLFTIIKLLIW